MPSQDPPTTASKSPDPRFSAEEEATLVAESAAQKSTANTLFSKSQYSEAVSTYDCAIASLPTYLDYEIAVLKSNISACHLKLEEWKEAIDSASASLDALDRVSPLPKPKDLKEPPGKGNEAKRPETDDTVVEISAETEADEKAQLQQLGLSDQRRADIARIRSKALLRRARAKTEQGGWGDLQSAQDDYSILLTPPLFSSLPAAEQRRVREQVRELGPRIEKAKEREMGEMMGKLKELGNGILKPFGLSTDMFKMQQGEGGGYSMSFDQSGGAGKEKGDGGGG